MRMYYCGCPAILPDGSTDYGPRIVGESGVWDLPCVSFAPNDTPLPLYQHGKQLDYRANKLSMKCSCLARNWEKFKRKLPSLPESSVFVPSTKDFHFANYRLQYKPERHPNPRMHLKDAPLLDQWSQLPICAAFHQRCEPPDHETDFEPPCRNRRGPYMPCAACCADTGHLWAALRRCDVNIACKHMGPIRHMD